MVIPRGETCVLAADGLDDVVGRGSEELGDDGELVDVVLSGEQWLALEHLGEDASRAPDINLDVVLLPGEHDLGGTVVSRRNISSHLGVLDPGQTEITDLEVAVLVDQDVARLEVPVNDTRRVDVLQSSLRNVSGGEEQPVIGTASSAHQYLVEEVLDELFLEGTRSQ